jgi:hypothetical protein
VRVSGLNAIGLRGTSPDGQWVSFGGRFADDRAGTIAVPVYGGEPRVLCYTICQSQWSPDAGLLYLAIGAEPPRQTLVLPLQPGHAFPEFPLDDSDAVTAWKKLPTTRLFDPPETVPGLDQSTYVVTKVEERRNLFRVPLPP